MANTVAGNKLKNIIFLLIFAWNVRIIKLKFDASYTFYGLNPQKAKKYPLFFVYLKKDIYLWDDSRKTN